MELRDTSEQNNLVGAAREGGVEMLKSVRALLAVVLSVAVAAAPVAASETIKQIKDRGSLQTCLAETAPMAVRDPATGKWSGYNINMAEDLARELGVKLDIVDQSYATIVPALLGKKCDIVMAPLLVNAQRAQVVAVSLDRKSTRLNSSHVRIPYAV